ncbi:hypothetical protein EC957_001420, partial [Mortierella hygrophila]
RYEFAAAPIASKLTDGEKIHQFKTQGPLFLSRYLIERQVKTWDDVKTACEIKSQMAQQMASPPKHQDPSLLLLPPAMDWEQYTLSWAYEGQDFEVKAMSKPSPQLLAGLEEPLLDAVHDDVQKFIKTVEAKDTIDAGVVWVMQTAAPNNHPESVPVEDPPAPLTVEQRQQVDAVCRIFA